MNRNKKECKKKLTKAYSDIALANNGRINLIQMWDAQFIIQDKYNINDADMYDLSNIVIEENK